MVSQQEQGLPSTKELLLQSIQIVYRLVQESKYDLAMEATTYIQQLILAEQSKEIILTSLTGASQTVSNTEDKLF